MQTVLLVDVMDTLVYNPFNREIPDFFGLSLPELLEAKHPSAWARFETGEIDEAEYLRVYFRDGRDFDHAVAGGDTAEAGVGDASLLRRAARPCRPRRQ